VPATPTPTTSAVPDPRHLLSVTAVPGGRPGHVVVQVTGEVDAYTAPLLQLCLDSQAGQDGLRELVVDLEQVTVLCADAVTVLARVHRRCRLGRARLVIRSGGQRAVLQPAGLADLVPSARPRSSSRRRRARGRRPAAPAAAEDLGATSPADVPVSVGRRRPSSAETG
jgi:anti-sigma B factor antagonist